MAAGAPDIIPKFQVATRRRGEPHLQSGVMNSLAPVTQCSVVQEQVGRMQRGGRLAPGMGLFQTCWGKAEMRAHMGVGKQR